MCAILLLCLLLQGEFYNAKMLPPMRNDAVFIFAKYPPSFEFSTPTCKMSEQMLLSSNGTPPNPPMSQETFEYLWATLGEVTSQGAPPTACKIVSNQSSGNLDGRQSSLPFTTGNQVVSSATMTPPEQTQNNNDVKVIVNTLSPPVDNTIAKFAKYPPSFKIPTSKVSEETLLSLIGTPPNPPMSQETFDYLWATLGEVTSQGTPPTACKIVSNQSSGNLDGRQSSLPFTTGNQVVSSATMTPPEQTQNNNDVKVIVNTLSPPVDNTIAKWLTNLGLSAYIDNFHQAGLYNLFQLDEFQLEDLSKMKIGTAHRNKIWKELLDFRSTSEIVNSQSQAMDRTSSSTSTMNPQTSTYSPGYCEVTRYTFKHSPLMKDDHDNH